MIQYGGGGSMTIAICGLVGMIGGFVAGCFDDGPVMGLAMCLIGAIAGCLLGGLVSLIFGLSPIG